MSLLYLPLSYPLLSTLTLSLICKFVCLYSAEFYGRCVSQFVTITTPVKYVTDPDIMVFVTYPMTQKVHLSLYLYMSFTTPVKYVTDPDIMVFVTYPMTQKVHLSLEPFICLHNHTNHHSHYNTYNHTHSFLSFQYTNSFTHVLTYSLPFVLPIRVVSMTLMRLLCSLVCSRTRVPPPLSLSPIAPQVNNTDVTTGLYLTYDSFRLVSLLTIQQTLLPTYKYNLSHIYLSVLPSLTSITP